MANRARIVVGIDFGTTSTSVAWARATPPIQIEMLRNWPTSGSAVGTSVPSQVSYGDGGTGVGFGWGYNVPVKSEKIRWFKLALETDRQVLALPAGMNASTVARDFLTAVYAHIIDTLERRIGAKMLMSFRVEFNLTVPAIWTDAAKRRTEDAAVDSGFPKDCLELLSEPESAAIYSLRTIEGLNERVKANDRILVCDAGGGTVDMIAYDIVQLEPRLSVKEAVAGTGEFCGSTFIDRDFETMVEQRLGPQYKSLSRLNREKIAENFETAKLAFRDSDEQPVFYIPTPGIANVVEAGIVDGNLELTREEMRSLFDNVVSQILELISDQLKHASGDGQKRVRALEPLYGVQVIQPQEARTAIAQGAVIAGLESDADYQTEVVRRARRSYGFPTSEKFISGKHSPEDLYIDAHTGERLAKNQISWFIRKNQILSDNETFERRFARDFRQPTIWSHVLVSSEENDPPTRIGPTIKPHCTISSNLTHLKSLFTRRWRRLQPYYTAEYQLVVGVRNNKLIAYLEFQNLKYGDVDIQFD